MRDIVDSLTQCWSCSIFDRLFQVISTASAGVYNQFATLCIAIFSVMLAFYVFNALWINMNNNFGPGWADKSFRPIIINSLIALTLLIAGVAVPKFITRITFEPVAEITQVYTEQVLQTTTDEVNSHVDYTPETITESNSGLFRPQLRDTIIAIAKTSITQFQTMMMLGIVIMDKAFSWSALYPLSNIPKHLIMFFVGLYFFWSFLKLFFNFLCYFTDILISMMFFAFFFPVSLIMMPFKNIELGKGPGWTQWMSKIGSGVGTDQIKNLISSIVSLGAVVITYTVIINIVAIFFSAQGTSSADLTTAIQTGDNFDLFEDNLNNVTIFGTLVLVYIINFISANIPQITAMIMEAFNVKLDKFAMGNAVANDLKGVADIGIKNVKNVTKIIGKGEEGAIADVTKAK